MKYAADLLSQGVETTYTSPSITSPWCIQRARGLHGKGQLDRFGVFESLCRRERQIGRLEKTPGKWRYKNNQDYSQTGNVVLKNAYGKHLGLNWGKKGDFLWAREAASSCLEAVLFSCLVGEKGGHWTNSWILYRSPLPTEMTAPSKIWIIARKGKKKNIKALKIDLLLSITFNLLVGWY